MKYYTLILNILVIFILCSCNGTSYNPKLTYRVVYEQPAHISYSTNYLIPIKNFIADKTYGPQNLFFFRDIINGQMHKCDVFEDTAYFSQISNIAQEILPVNILHNPNKCFYNFNHNTNVVSCQNYMGKVQNTYQLDQAYGLINLLSGLETKNNSSILINNASKTIGFGTVKERLNYYREVRPLVLINIFAEGIENKAFGFWPIGYVNTGNNYNDPYAKACFGSNNKICVSFSADHNLYLYNDTNLIFSKQNKSNYIDNFKAYPDEKVFDMAYLREYIQMEPKYTNLIFDPWNKMYYRTVKHPFLNSKTGSEVKRYWSVIVTDDELNIIGECKFSSQYDPHVFTPTPFGILLMKGNFPDSKERTITLIKLSAHE